MKLRAMAIISASPSSRTFSQVSGLKNPPLAEVTILGAERFTARAIYSHGVSESNCVGLGNVNLYRLYHKDVEQSLRYFGESADVLRRGAARAFRVVPADSALDNEAAAAFSPDFPSQNQRETKTVLPAASVFVRALV